MRSDKNSDRVGRNQEAEGALDEALRSETNYDYGPVTEFDHLKTRLEARAASPQSENRQSQERTIMGRVYNQINNMNRRSRMAVTVSVAVAALALFTLVPFTYQDTIGYEVAFAGVDRDIALNEKKLHEVLEQLGVEGAVVDVFGCEKTCNLRITDLKSAYDAKLVSIAFGDSKNVRLVHADGENTEGIEAVVELKTGSLLDKARNTFLASGSGDEEATSLMELHEIVLEKLGSDFNPDCALWVKGDGTSFSGDSLADFTESVGKAMFIQADTIGILGATWILQRNADGLGSDATSAGERANAFGAFKIALAADNDTSFAGATIMCVGDSGNRFTCSVEDLSLLEFEDGSLSDEDIESLRRKGYKVDIQESADGGRVITLTRDSQGESGGNSWVEEDVIIETTDDDLLGKSATSALPEGYALSQNYPNPFNPTTKIDYSIAGSEHVTIEIINVMGQVVRTLVDETVSAGQHTVEWDSRSDTGVRVASGMYFYRFRAGNVVETKKMALLK